MGEGIHVTVFPPNKLRPIDTRPTALDGSLTSSLMCVTVVRTTVIKSQLIYTMRQ